MVKISFTFVNVQGSLDALECNDQSTLAEIYNSVNQAVGNQYTASLSLDQVNILPNDNTPLNLSGEVLMYVQLTTQLSIIVFIDGAQVTEASISGSVTLENFVQQLLLNLNQKAAIQDYQILSQNQELLASSPTINLQTPFQDYGQQQLLLNLTLQKPKDEEQLDSLVVLDGMSLTIDPQGEFVSFKLHKPILLSGQLKKQQGKQELNIDLNQNWITHGQISYANPNLQGLIVKWSDGTYSAVETISKEKWHEQLKLGYLIVRDERIDWSSGEEYFNLMEEYFEKRANQLEQTGTVDDCFPQYKYQIGIGNENIGRPNYDEKSIADMIDKPVIINRDPKWKYFWPFRYEGETLKWTPKDFPQFEQVMTKWQSQLLKTTESVVAQLSLAFGEDESYFYDKMKEATQLLSPIGCDLKKHKVNTRFSGYHYDLNFLTVHTKCRFPGLFVWLPDGKRIEVKIPEKTVLLQPGMQFEFMTGGQYKAGYHEAVYTEESYQLQQKSKKRWRVTSTLFTSLSPNTILQPMDYFKGKTGYGPISVEEQFKKELNKLNYQ